MDPIGSINSFSPQALTQLKGLTGPEFTKTATAGQATQAAPTDAFGNLLDNLVGSVTAKQSAADLQTSQVLLGDSSQLHQSVIAMQEATMSLSLMVQVRNKLVESYQELMRMQV